MNAVSELWRGRAGLALSFWLWGVVGGIVWNLFLVLVPLSIWPLLAATVACIAYFVVVYTGIWRAAEFYQGNPVFHALARIAVVLGAIALIAMAGLVATSALTELKRPGSSGISNAGEHMPQGAATKSEPGPWQAPPPNLQPFNGKLDGEK